MAHGQPCVELPCGASTWGCGGCVVRAWLGWGWVCFGVIWGWRMVFGVFWGWFGVGLGVFWSGVLGGVWAVFGVGLECLEVVWGGMVCGLFWGGFVWFWICFCGNFREHGSVLGGGGL